MPRVDARSLLTPKRLDYAVKWRFFRHLLAGGDPNSERVYRWHIAKRTGGTEIDYRTERVTKRGIDEYVESSRALLASMQKCGFTKDGAVPIDRNGLPLDGSHRISAALALGIKVRVRLVKRVSKRTWGFDWFAENGMSDDDLKRIVSDWCSLRFMA